jgi:virginiamycin B lyase
MMIRHSRLAIAVAMVATSILLCTYFGGAADNDCSVQGVVKNASGQPVSGAFVKLKNAERRLTFMVISRAQGLYMAANLPPGRYTVQGIGNGFQSEWSKPVEVAGGKSAKLDLSLTAQRAAALAPAWPTGYVAVTEEHKPIPFPDGEGNQIVAKRCVTCHDAARIVWTRGDQGRWQHIITEMRQNMKAMGLEDLTDQEANVVTQYLVTSFPAVPGPDPSSRLPRILLQGEAAKFRAVQYEVATPYAETHDIALDPQGNGWIDQRSAGKLGRLDGKTLVYTEVAPPPGKVRMHNLDIDPQGRAWFQDRMIDSRLFSYDTRTGEWNVFAIPKGLTRYAGGQHVEATFADGNLYSGGSNQIVKMNLATKEFSVFDVPSWVKTKQNVGIYGIAVASDGDVWFAESRTNQMGRLDPKTGEIDEIKIPFDGVAFPRRMGTDAAGDIWVGVWAANKLMKVDHKTGEMTLYDPPTNNGGAYYVSVDKKNNLVWVSLQKADKLDRFNPKTGEWVEFSLPEAESDPRKIEVDRTNPNRIWWAGNLANRFGYIEVLDENRISGNR